MGCEPRFVIALTPPKHSDKMKASRIFVFIGPAVNAELAKESLRLLIAESEVKTLCPGCYLEG